MIFQEDLRLVKEYIFLLTARWINHISFIHICVIGYDGITIPYEDIRLGFQHDKISPNFRDIIPLFAIWATHTSLYTYLNILEGLRTKTTLDLHRFEVDGTEKASFYAPHHYIVIIEVLVALVCVCSTIL